MRMREGGMSQSEGDLPSSSGHTTKLEVCAARAARSTKTSTKRLDSSLFLFLDRRPAIRRITKDND